MSSPGQVLTVNGLSGTYCRLAVDRNCTISDVKQAIEKEIGIKTIFQRLLLGDRFLDDYQVVESIGGDAITLVKRSEEQVEWLSRAQQGKLCGQSLKKAPDHIKSDREVIQAALWHADRWERRAIQAAVPEELLDDSDFALSVFRRPGFGGFLNKLTGRLRDSKEIVLAACRSGSGMARYESVPRGLFFFVGPTLQADRDFFLKALEEFTHVTIEYASASIQDDIDVVLAVVRRDGSELKYASPRLKADFEVVLAAVSSDACPEFPTLQYADPQLCNNREIVLAAIRKAGHSLQYASEALKDDKEVVLSAIDASDGSVLGYASHALRSSRHVVLYALEKDGNNLRFASAACQDDRSLVLVAINKSWSALKFASSKLRDDRQVVLAAIGKSFKAIKLASARLKADVVVAKAATARRRSGRVPRCVEPTVKKSKAVQDMAAKARGNGSFSMVNVSNQRKATHRIMVKARKDVSVIPEARRSVAAKRPARRVETEALLKRPAKEMR